MIYELSKSKKNLTAEQEQLKTQFNNLTGEMEALQKQYDSVVTSRDRLQEEFDRLNPKSNVTGRKFETPERLFFSKGGQIMQRVIGSITSCGHDKDAKRRPGLCGLFEIFCAFFNLLLDCWTFETNSQSKIVILVFFPPERTCPSSWIKFGNKCYFVSPSSQKQNYANSRKDCHSRGGDLVKITSRLELDFVKTHHAIAWIGLTRAEDGHSWVWVDGTTLENHEFWQDGEPNNADMEEDCVEVSREASAWNDVPCSRLFSWLCES